MLAIGKVYNFDGKIGLFPCTEKKPTQRRSKAGPKGTMVEVNRNVDSEFYEELFTKEGGVFDMIEKICPWLRGKYYFLQQDGARPHTKEGLIRQLEMQVGTGEVDDFFCRFITQPPNFPDVNLNDLAFFHSIKTQKVTLLLDSREDETCARSFQILSQGKDCKNMHVTSTI